MVAEYQRKCEEVENEEKKAKIPKPRKPKPRIDLSPNPTQAIILASNRRILEEFFGDCLSNLEYLGEKTFKTLYAKIWLDRVKDAITRNGGQNTVSVESQSNNSEPFPMAKNAGKADRENGKNSLKKKTKTRRNETIRIGQFRNEEQPHCEGMVDEDDLPATLPEAPIRLDKRDMVFELVEGLGFLEEYLTRIDRPSLAEIANAKTLFFKVSTIPGPDLKYSGQPKDTPEDDSFREKVNGLAYLTIESLWNEYDPDEIEVSEATLWNFVKKHLGLKQDAFYARRHQYLLAIKAAPDVLELRFWKNGAGRLWLREMGNWLGDLEKVQNDAALNNSTLPVCLALERYLRTMVASGHPKHAGNGQDRIQSISINDLIATNNPALVKITIPSFQTFYEFIDDQNILQNKTLARLPTCLEELKEALQTMRPKPQRLFGLLGLLTENITKKLPRAVVN